MAIITNTDVFDFCGTPADIRATQGSALTGVIDRIQDDVQTEINRPIDDLVLVDTRLYNNFNCRILDSSIYLYLYLADTYFISNIKASGVIVTDYTFNKQGAEIILNNNVPWNIFEVYTISGNSRMGGQAGSQAIKQILIELVAIRFGLWKKTIVTEGGRIEVDRSFEKRWKQLMKFKRVIY